MWGITFTMLLTLASIVEFTWEVVTSPIRHNTDFLEGSRIGSAEIKEIIVRKKHTLKNIVA